MLPIDMARRFLSELRRRKVFGVVAAYALVAWGVIEVTGTILQMAAAPPWIARAVLAVVAAGFPVAVVLAWFFDVSAAGLVRTAPLGAEGQEFSGSRGRAGQAIAATVLLAGAGIVATFAIWIRPDSTADVEFTQLTNFADAATAPALSPDGRMLAFLKGTGLFGHSAARAGLYVKALPDGEAVPLTASPAGKATPTFSPDGARIYFTSVEQGFRWNTHAVSVNGGHESLVLPNASGLTFLDASHVLLAQVRAGAHMGIRRATLTGEQMRDVYWPGEDGMAHRAAASPDRRWVLVVEMEGGIWQPCRLLPLDGSSRGRQVGPPGAQCTHAAWSPDGRWMYFSSNAGGTFHLWRQRFPDGEPRQLTSGPTEEEGIAVAPDGRSLITSAGVRYNSIRLLENDRERPVSVEGYAFSPVASRDGKRVYFLSRDSTSRLPYTVGSLVVTELASGVREALLPGHTMVHFDLSADDRHIVFSSGSAAAERRGIWVAPLDKSSAPRRVFNGETERVFFDPADNIYFLRRDGAQLRLHRLRAPGYLTSERVAPEPMRYIFAVSPDGEWIAGVADRPDRQGLQQLAISTRGLPPRTLCRTCGLDGGPARLSAPGVSWTRDGRAFLAAGPIDTDEDGVPGRAYTIIIPAEPGDALSNLPSPGIEAARDYLDLPGARKVARSVVLPGATPDQLFFYETTTLRNLYRVRLR